MEPLAKPLIEFLETDLALPTELVTDLLKACGKSLNRLPIILWQRKLVTPTQLEQICSWMAKHAQRLNQSRETQLIR